MIALVMFPIAALLGFFRGRRHAERGTQLRWPFYVWPFSVPLLLTGVGIWILIFYIPEDEFDWRMANAFGLQFVINSAFVAIPHIGTGIGGFYLKRRKLSDDA